MLFNSFSFALFFPIIFIFYWILKYNFKYQNILLLVASYYFYSCWDWRFLFLLLFSTVLDFYSGIKIYAFKNNPRIQKMILILCITINLGILVVFKYHDFFMNSFYDTLELTGITLNRELLNLILPVGISFYTFHGLSYVIDIKKERIKPEYNFVNYSLFVSFFPLLVAGPIERATHLLPQIRLERKPEYSKLVDGLRQVLWGLFKKIVIADQVASLVNQIFENYQNYSGAVLLIGAVLFSIQIYCDFSGYTDIALGSARMLGFELLQNFNYPYFSRNLAEFWRRWHISLSSWFRDYLYIPLGGSKVPFTRKILNVFIIFVVSGFWHGANWTFIMWGLLNAIFVLPSLLTKSKNNSTEIVALHTKLPSFYESIQLFTTFSLVCLIFIVFRAPSITMSYNYYFTLFTDLFNKSSIIGAYNYLYWEVGMILPCLILLLFLIEWVGRKRKSPLSILSKFNYKINFFIYTFLIMLILFFSGKESDFIYFQF